MDKISALSLTPAQMQEALVAMGQPGFRAKQLFRWLHVEKCGAFADMTNLPAALRQQLAEEWVIDVPRVVQRQASRQDGTVKMLLELADGHCVETVLMRYQHGYSVCVSSQVGCRMGCRFCASTRNGLVRNLTAGEMVAQLWAAEQEAGQRVAHLVLMGIGEPLDNYDNVVDFIRVITDAEGRDIPGRGISLSTCGLAPGIERLAEENLSLTLSISLHATTDAQRGALMPVNQKWPLDTLLAACRDYRKKSGRRISFEYTLLAGVNDSDEDASRLAALLRGSDGHVNLIAANAVDGSPYTAPEAGHIARFQALLQQAGVQATVRRRLGGDIDAACGQLRLRHGEENDGL